MPFRVQIIQDIQNGWMSGALVSARPFRLGVLDTHETWISSVYRGH